ncbi:MAG: hypothetical protein NUW23_07065 [Firmicutes bacterium]|jgi:hypothetical protein|nr:hypothetical protein [Bacillota bacterium]
MGEEKRSDVESSLCKKGFRRSNGSHCKFVFYTRGGKKTSVWTETSHGSKHRDLSDFTLGKMADQCRLPYPQFRRLIECPMSREEYEALLVQNGEVKE